MDKSSENQHIEKNDNNLEELNILKINNLKFSNDIPKKRGRKPLNKTINIEIELNKGNIEQSIKEINTKSINEINTKSVNEINTKSINEINTKSINEINTKSINTNLINEEDKEDEEVEEDKISDEQSINLDEEKIPKKRGRKPKIKLEEEVEKIPKKRGRKPKEKIYSVKELPKTFFEENKNETLILHLPINLNNLNNNYPLPNIEDNYSYIENINNNNNISDNLLTQNNLLENNNINNILSNKNNHLKNVQEEETNKNNELMNINNFKTTNAEINNAWDNDYKNNNKVIKKNLRNILYEFINANNDKVWPEKTNIHCWWCCHQFDNTPCSLPQYYKKDKFYVKGIYCSFNCAASYNFNNNDDDMFEKYSLLNLMYKKLYDRNFIKISLSPPRETLKMFGGYLSIEEFRENSLENNKLFNVICPPLISIIPKIEETVNHNKFSSHTLLGNVNESILSKTQNSLKLKRNKPILNPNNTLQTFMDLKINLNN
jgi:hypothetical protein